MLQILHRFLPISPILEHSQRQQWNPGWTNLWSLRSRHSVGAGERFMCLGPLGKRICWCEHLAYFIAEHKQPRPRLPVRGGRALQSHHAPSSAPGTDKSALEKWEYVGFPELSFSTYFCVCQYFLGARLSLGIREST